MRRGFEVARSRVSRSGRLSVSIWLPAAPQHDDPAAWDGYVQELIERLAAHADFTGDFGALVLAVKSGARSNAASSPGRSARAGWWRMLRDDRWWCATAFAMGSRPTSCSRWWPARGGHPRDADRLGAPWAAACASEGPHGYGALARACARRGRAWSSRSPPLPARSIRLWILVAGCLLGWGNGSSNTYSNQAQ